VPRRLVPAQGVPMKALDLMSSAPVTVAVTDSVSHAAELMRERGVGCLPVVDAPSTLRLRGLITDRDIARKLGPTEPKAVEELLERVSTPGLVGVGG
jgi:CBS domain-containing protein